MRWTRGGQKRFTILEVAADWHELMIPQHYATIHCLHQQTSGPKVCSKQTYHGPNQPQWAFTP